MLPTIQETNNWKNDKLFVDESSTSHLTEGDICYASSNTLTTRRQGSPIVTFSAAKDVLKKICSEFKLRISEAITRFGYT